MVPFEELFANPVGQKKFSKRKNNDALCATNTACPEKESISYMRTSIKIYFA
jgi:hypothetical protein